MKFGEPQTDILGQGQQRPEQLGELELFSKEMECSGCPQLSNGDYRESETSFSQVCTAKGKQQWAQATADGQMENTSQ